MAINLKHLEKQVNKQFKEYMSSYNLKRAKNKQTGEISYFYFADHHFGINKCAYQIVKPFYDHNDKIFTQDEFNTLYEVIDEPKTLFSDTIKKLEERQLEQIRNEKWWENEFRINFVEAGYEIFGDADEIKKFIYKVETEAYIRGQEDAYKKSAEVAMGCIVNTIGDDSEKAYNQGCINTSKAIEQLASNK